MGEYFRAPLLRSPLYISQSLGTVVMSEVMSVGAEGCAGADHSWQDVYASYGCSLDFDASDDDG